MCQKIIWILSGFPLIVLLQFRPGFGEAVYGRKRWFLTEPEFQPEFHPNKTTLQWFLQDYEKVKKEVNLQFRGRKII